MDDEDCFVIGLAPEQEESATVEDLWQYTAQPEVGNIAQPSARISFNSTVSKVPDHWDFLNAFMRLCKKLVEMLLYAKTPVLMIR
jgi:hypothetical protein